MRTVSQTTGSLISGRITFVTQPTVTTTTTTTTGGTIGGTTGGTGGSGGASGGPGGPGGSGGSGGGSGSGSGGQDQQSIPVPGKDRAALWTGGSLIMAGGPSVLKGQEQSLPIIPMTGLSAGDAAGDKRCGVWTMAAMNWIGNTQESTKFNGNVFTSLLGFDFKPTPKIVTGVAAGYQAMDLKTSYNNGWSKNYGLTVMPYASYSFTDTLIADAAFGLTFVKNSTSRVDTTTNLDVRGEYPSLRTLGTANLTYYYLLDNWTFSAKGGVLLTNEHRFQYTEGDGTSHSAGNTFLGELILGGKAGYRYKRMTFQAGVNYLYDFATEMTNDRNEIQGLVGASCQFTDALMLNVEVNNSFLRQNMRNTGLVGTLRFEF